MKHVNPTVSAVRRNEAGIITDVRLSDGKTLSKDRAIAMAKDEEIDGVNVGRARDGSEILRGNPTSKPLSQLPTF